MRISCLKNAKVKQFVLEKVLVNDLTPELANIKVVTKRGFFVFFSRFFLSICFFFVFPTFVSSLFPKFFIFPLNKPNLCFDE